MTCSMVSCNSCVRRTSYCVPAGPRLTRVLAPPLREEPTREADAAEAEANAPHAAPFTAKPVVAFILGLLFMPRNTFGRLSPSHNAMQCRMASSKCEAVHGLACPVKASEVADGGRPLDAVCEVYGDQGVRGQDGRLSSRYQVVGKFSQPHCVQGEHMAKHTAELYDEADDRRPAGSEVPDPVSIRIWHNRHGYRARSAGRVPGTSGRPGLVCTASSHSRVPCNGNRHKTTWCSRRSSGRTSGRRRLRGRSAGACISWPAISSVTAACQDLMSRCRRRRRRAGDAGGGRCRRG